MPADDLGLWSPLSLTAVDVFGTAPFRWFVAGGHALELAVGRSWRAHDDVDVGVCRQDAGAVHRHLAGWDLHVAAKGVLFRWDGRPLSPQHHENNVWARRSAGGAWSFDVVVGGGDAEMWWSRRDPFIRLPWTDAIGHASGIPYLAPQAQLLMKSKDVRAEDVRDAEVVIPLLEPESRRWLGAHLSADHPWQRFVEGSTGRTPHGRHP